MRTSLNERLLDLAVNGFMWGFRILIVLVTVCCFLRTSYFVIGTY